MTDPVATFDRLLAAAWGDAATDLHLVPGQAPRMRTRDGRLVVRDEPAFSAPDLRALAGELFSPAHLAQLEREGSARRPLRRGDVTGRLALASTRGQISLAIRYWRGPTELTLDAIGAPTVLQQWLGASHGLIVVSGPHGSGKTTTLHAATEWLNANRPLHLCTVEDPLVREFESKQALVQQREVGIDVPTVAAGIAAAMGQDLDALVVAALPDLDALSATLHAAETGHLVLVQVHANTAEEALERMVEATPTSMHAMVRRSLSEILLGVLGQRLIPRATGQGRVAAYEALAPSDALQALLLGDAPLRDLPRGPGSHDLADDLARLVRERAVAHDDAAALVGSAWDDRLREEGSKQDG